MVAKFSEHYHDAWAATKLENGWVYGDTWSDEQKSHPRLKPYNMLSEYVRFHWKFKNDINFSQNYSALNNCLN